MAKALYVDVNEYKIVCTECFNEKAGSVDHMRNKQLSDDDLTDTINQQIKTLIENNKRCVINGCMNYIKYERRSYPV